MTTDNPQVPWTDEQWARVNKVVQEEASRVRIAATFLPLLGPLPGDTDFVRQELYPVRLIAGCFGAGISAADTIPPPIILGIQDRPVIQLATLQVRVPVRGAQMADPEMTSVLALFRRAASVLARLEDAVVFRGLVPDLAFPGQNRFAPPINVGPPPPQRVWEITGGQPSRGLWTMPLQSLRRRRLTLQRAASNQRRAAGGRDSRRHWPPGSAGPFRTVRGGA